VSEKNGKSSVEEQIRALYESAESRTAQAMEELVGKRGFGALLAMSAENVAAVARISADMADLVLRNLRVAGRADITRLARQLHRTEDKLERVLQEVEALRDELAARDRADAGRDGAREAGATADRTVAGKS
jgi:hypothetical protein